MQNLLIRFSSLFFNNFIHVYIVLWSYSFPLPSLIPFSLPLDSVFSMSFFLASTSLFLNYPLRLIRVACMRINVGYYWHIGNLPVKKSNIPSFHSCRYSGVGPLSHAFIHSGVLMGSVFYRICAGDLSYCYSTDNVMATACPKDSISHLPELTFFLPPLLKCY